MANGNTHNGKPCRIEEMNIGDTIFTVISVQSDAAKETAYEKVKTLILDNTKNTMEQSRKTSV